MTKRTILFVLGPFHNTDCMSHQLTSQNLMKCLLLQSIQQSFTKTTGNIGKTQIPTALFLKTVTADEFSRIFSQCQLCQVVQV